MRPNEPRFARVHEAREHPDHEHCPHEHPHHAPAARPVPAPRAIRSCHVAYWRRVRRAR